MNRQGGYIEHFLEYLQIERRYSLLTVSAYRHDLEEFCSFLHIGFAALDPDSVTDDDIKEWLISLMDNGISARSVRRKLSSLRSFWKYCLRVGVAHRNPTQLVLSPKISKPLPVFYKEREMRQERELERFADDFISVRDNLIIEMLYQTGMRRAELIALSDGDVNEEARQIRVFGKRRKQRIIPVGDDLLEQILQYRQWRDECYPERADDALFLTKKGRRINAATVYAVVHDRMMEVSTQKKQSPHVLRHTFATAMLDNGADINTIKTLMGHASLAATQVYTHVTFEQMKKAYAAAHPRNRTGKNGDTE